MCIKCIILPTLWRSNLHYCVTWLVFRCLLLSFIAPEFLHYFMVATCSSVLRNISGFPTEFQHHYFPADFSMHSSVNSLRSVHRSDALLRILQKRAFTAFKSFLSECNNAFRNIICEFRMNSLCDQFYSNYILLPGTFPLNFPRTMFKFIQTWISIFFALVQLIMQINARGG